MDHERVSMVVGIRGPVPTPAGASGEQGMAAKAVHLLSIVEKIGLRQSPRTAAAEENTI